MKLRLVFSTLGIIVIIIGLSMLLPLAWAIYYGSHDIYAFLISSTTALIVGFTLYKVFKTQDVFRYKEGFAVVSLAWIFATIFGSLPYLLSGTFDNFADAIFETMSGFTTTGATVISNIEILPHGILVWRSLTHWLGGMGIVVLFVALLSSIGTSGMQMFKAEAPGPVKEKLKPRISESAKMLWYIYVALTGANFLLLWIFGMSFFDAMCHAFSTVATGGFSNHNTSIGFYDSYAIHFISTLFMFLAGTNFTLYYLALHNNDYKIFWKSEEFRLYLTIILGAIIIIFGDLFIHNYGNPFKILDDASLQVVSIITTTGFVSADFDQWPGLSKSIIFTLLFIGGCAGSTSGGIKVWRILVLLKHTHLELKRAIHPRLISPLKIQEKIVPDEVLIKILQFFFIYMFIFIISTVIISSFGYELIDSMSSVIATLGNTGPGLNKFGPTQNFLHAPAAAKFLFSFLMLLGRLELYTVLVLFSPVFWKK
ncbi:trk system potassium uptake protein TrkH [Desulfonispora thiosulfatigenes DSM 11270]|uniref:Trk system potassium uptake protein TrkH n=1 Tax=Desulfonispora thiosulfatigenes DSM 11270 TaxID=656914 RepID=A0A1W1VMN9_DESTI|nr:TrkH family potassium uptake protein [Desulfonispora thiosulfatigenes]SMB94553.1 trk system potassium uptake protein TrkH [Desulfonispora thiosulfatigenes DSM 11270]